MGKMSDKMRRHSGKMRTMKDVLSVFTTFGRYGAGWPANSLASQGAFLGQLGPSWGHLGPRLAGLLAGSPEPYLRKVVKTLRTSFIFRILPLCRFILSLILSILIHLIPISIHLERHDEAT